MLINVIPYEEDKSSPITNYISFKHSRSQFYARWYMQEYHEVKHPGLNSKQIFKKVFGRQMTCINYVYRNWIWTFANSPILPPATIYCLIDGRGVHWEMDISSWKSEIAKLRGEIEERLIA